jgi:hypothetical protein
MMEHMIKATRLNHTYHDRLQFSHHGNSQVLELQVPALDIAQGHRQVGIDWLGE